MKTLYLIRIDTGEDGTFGLLLSPGLPGIHTLEPPWKGNRANVSCIPAGIYLCKFRKSPRFGWTYHVTGVPNRSNILIHSGNLVKHTLGCIIPGMKRGYLGSKKGVLNSRRAVREIHQMLRAETFLLRISGGDARDIQY